MIEPTLRDLLHGKGAHTDPVACLEDVPTTLAGRKIDGYPHSIWQIVGHLNYWMDYELRRIAGELPSYPEHAIESWPASDVPKSDDEWKDAVMRFVSLLDRFAELSDSGPEVLNRHVEAMHPSHSAQSSTVQAVLWQIVAHNSYHIGQIALLRRRFGAWPPPTGSDTW
jgi:uncharacterized damage-inducible protein DinB